MHDNNYAKTTHGSIEEIREHIRHRLSDEDILIILTKHLPDATDDERRKLIEKAHNKAPELYYDGTRYWIENANGNWITIRVEDVRRELKNAGFNWSTQNGDRVSQVDRAIGDIQHNKYVDYVGPLAGYMSGIHTIYGKRILVQDSPMLLTPEVGAYPMLDSILNRMLGQQRVYLEGWLSVAAKSLYSGQFRVGQALVLAGPGNSGKSLLQYLITKRGKYKSSRRLIRSESSNTVSASSANAARPVRVLRLCIAISFVYLWTAA
jgi:hypothetical protein